MKSRGWEIAMAHGGGSSAADEFRALFTPMAQGEEKHGVGARDVEWERERTIQLLRHLDLIEREWDERLIMQTDDSLLNDGGTEGVRASWDEAEAGTNDPQFPWAFPTSEHLKVSIVDDALPKGWPTGDGSERARNEEERESLAARRERNRGKVHTVADLPQDDFLELQGISSVGKSQVEKDGPGGGQPGHGVLNAGRRVRDGKVVFGSLQPASFWGSDSSQRDGEPPSQVQGLVVLFMFALLVIAFLCGMSMGIAMSSGRRQKRAVVP